MPNNRVRGIVMDVTDSLLKHYLDYKKFRPYIVDIEGNDLYIYVSLNGIEPLDIPLSYRVIDPKESYCLVISYAW